jgi:hypothetical protein
MHTNPQGKEGSAMKKFAVAFTALVFAASANAANLSLDWGTPYGIDGTGAPDAFAPPGEGAPGTGLIPMSSDWRAEIVRQSDLQVLFTATPGVFWGQVGEDGAPLQSVQAPESWDAVPVFTRIYNNASTVWTPQLKVAEVGQRTFDWDTSAPPSASATRYEFSLPASAWQSVIPEPGVTSLLAIGLGTLFYRRMKMRKAA